jgi:hypothetical protein
MSVYPYKMNSVLLLFFLSLFTFETWAGNNVINIVTFGESTVKDLYVQDLRAALKNKINEIDIKKDTIVNPEGIFITIGAKSLIGLLELNIPLPTLSVFVKKSSFYHIIKTYEHKSLAQGFIVHTKNIGVIYSDPPLDKQVRLIREIFGNSASFGVVVSPITNYMQNEILLLAEENDISVKFVKYNAGININKTINSLKKQDVILAIPDQLIWNSSTLKNIVLSTYRNEQPIIGFSRNLVKAGAIATHFSDLDDVVKETVDRITLMNQKSPIIIRSSSKQTSLVTNDNVIRSLNLNKPMK